MPIHKPVRAMFFGLTLAASASIALGQQPASSRRTTVLERLPSIEQQAEPTPAVVPAIQSELAPVQLRPASRLQEDDLPPPAAVPMLPPGAMHGPVDQGAIPAGAVAGKGSGQSPYLSDRVRYRWEKMKYRWQHYWKPGLQEHHWGYPEEFCEKPLGYYVYAHARTQVANGEAARMMLYEYDFEPGQARLTPRGREQLAKLAFMLPRNFFPLVIEQSDSGNPQLDDQRRQMVLAFLQQSGFPVPEERIVVGMPMNRGISGAEGPALITRFGESINTGGESSGLNTSTQLSTQ